MIRSSPPLARSERKIQIAFASTILCFVGSMLYVQHQISAIDADAKRIADDAAPGIEHLAAARAEVRHLQVILRREIFRGLARQPVRIQAAAASRQRLDRELAGYLKLAVMHGERPLWDRIDGELRA